MFTSTRLGGVMTDQQPVSALAEEEIEGIGNPDDIALGEYPLDTMLIRNESRTIYDVLRRIGQGQFIMDPDFQRDFIWPVDKQSKLIESVLMRIPLPVFYIAENEDGHMVVVDGLQRLSTFKNFVDGGLRLRLPSRPDLNGRQFIELSPLLQNRIEDCNLTLYVIDSKAPEQARLDIFDRVNSGLPLSRQQMRNCLHMGPATRFLKAEAEQPIFLTATGGSLNRAQMRDREFINRFCGFQIFALDEYRGDMDLFLSQTLNHMNALKPEELEGLSVQLRTGLANNNNLFGRYAFRKHSPDRRGRRGFINASLWDVMCAGLARYEEDKIQARENALLSAFYRLLNDEEFNDAITLGTNQANRVERRFEMANDMFREVFGD